MIINKTKRIVTTGTLLALGIVLPFVTAHGLGIQGTVFLPMHFPVLLCGFLCDGPYGALLGFILPFLNSAITGMPVIFPNAVVMSFELATYGLVSGSALKLFSTKKLTFVYLSLISALLLGRVVYGIVAGALLFFAPELKMLSVFAATATGLPGIIIQLVIVPPIILKLSKLINDKPSAKAEAISLIKIKRHTFVVVKENEITFTSSHKGVAPLIEFLKTDLLQDAFVADTVVGKAAAMLFALGGIKECYAQKISKKALDFFSENNIKVAYGELVDYIVNRDGTGACPMESAVAETFDPNKALKLINEKLKEFRNNK